ncbi:MAG: hypothetical protein HGA22_04065, partial [Clostridiales bacterium]|nr:hypothetical protein [Clostridiales bacterium]
MKQRKRVEWSRLDNASKFFSATSNDKDTKVFRIACELYEAVDAEVLQKALDITMERFPLYRSVLRRGVFWYYIENSDIKPVVEKETKPVCAPIYLRDRRNLLFRVFFHNCRINLEVFHALSDGTGALWFMQTLVHYYLLLRHKPDFAGSEPKLNYGASISRQLDDSFNRHYSGKDSIIPMLPESKSGTTKKAYVIRGNRIEDNRIKVIEGLLSAKAVLKEAHEYDTTLTIYLTALFIYSIYKDMPAHKGNKPVVLSVPINLRQFYESESARNFFSTINISYDFSSGATEFGDVVKSVAESFKKELAEERMAKHIHRFMSLERNIITRLIPLPLKDYTIRVANKLIDREVSAAISNVGRITMPPEFERYIRQFSIMTSARRPQLTICTYGDKLVASFTSPLRETEIQRIFFNSL